MEFLKCVIILIPLSLGGKYFTHCIGVNAKSAIANFEKMVLSLGVPVKVDKTEDHVPSFMEKWVWFQVTRLEGDITKTNGEAEQTKETKDESKEKPKETEKEKEKETKKDKKEEKKDEKKEEKKEEKKAGAKDLKDQLEGKEKGLTKEKSNVEKKTKKGK